ncbi:MAG: UDP-N-acetylmuramoyl-L-alanyl-D-glutamate--2,6-diaminopimelate ligase [Planctomycetes bacterium]|nr:UDP-N-acetylmuramoyl-L-alanyl-D-glutamate--2,6-diaminopimelate ligase [Planctomycetota bacterium]
MNIEQPASALQWIPHLPVPVNLRRLFPRASFVGCGDIRVTDATDRSSDCRAHSLFAVIRGPHADGHAYIAAALDKGASALLVDRPLADYNVPQCVVPDVRQAYAELCGALHGHPSHHLGLAGVTGTNGKTTTTWLIRSILQAAGHQTGLLGTIEYHDGVRSEPSQLTTPGSAALARRLAGMIAVQTTHAAMELSSHALDQHRTGGTLLDAALITNITQDHFDYHKDFAAYRRSKARIFECVKSHGVAIVNADDPGSRSCVEFARNPVVTFGLEQPADVSAQIQSESLLGSQFLLQVRGASVLVETSLIGRHNIANCLAAAAVGCHFGIDLPTMARGLGALKHVPGRLELVAAGQPFPVFVDYAHTDDALRNVLRSLRPLTPGRVICVFGAGGDRDKLKRPLLGRAAAEADLPIVTSDNPRSEDSAAIVNDILPGFEGTRRPPFVELDRERAIRWAIQHAGPGDCVLIAGKGHETEQIVGTDRRHFDDREVARDCLTTLFPPSVTPSPHVLVRNSVRI